MLTPLYCSVLALIPKIDFDPLSTVCAVFPRILEITTGLLASDGKLTVLSSRKLGCRIHLVPCAVWGGHAPFGVLSPPVFPQQCSVSL